MYDLIVIGGGASGVFAAIQGKTFRPDAKILILEKSNALLSKLLLTGGGRCNLTNATFEPLALAGNYPRGFKELVGPFSRFGPKETMEWFEARGVKLKIEAEGRVFPLSDKAETIARCLKEEIQRLGIEAALGRDIQQISKNDHFSIVFQNGETIFAKCLLFATGSSLAGYGFAKNLGHTIISPVPSLFAFDIVSPLQNLSGVCKSDVELALFSFRQRGQLLITHDGFSGPAAIKLSSWAARELHKQKYEADLFINWLPEMSENEIFNKLKKCKESSSSRIIANENPLDIPKNIWKRLLDDFQNISQKALKDISVKTLANFASKLHRDRYRLCNERASREEFVSCGGVALKEVDFKTMQSKICPRLFFAGEILDIDGLTGGYNLQNAWTTGYLAGFYSSNLSMMA